MASRGRFASFLDETALMGKGQSEQYAAKFQDGPMRPFYPPFLELLMNVHADPTPQFDAAAAESFAGDMAGILNAGALAVMLSFGHQTSLFDHMADLPPSTSDEIAKAATLSERYVREWLAAMVTGRIVHYEPKGALYHLPPEHAAALTRGAPMGNFASTAQLVSMIGASEKRLLDCFKTGEGTKYEDYPCFHKVMAEDSGQTVVAQMFDVIVPMVPGLNGRLRDGIDVMDAGCGEGKALVALAEYYSASRFVGYDLCADAIATANDLAQSKGLTNLRFEVKDLTGYDAKDAFDFVTSFDAVHDQKDPQALVTSLYGCLRPGGAYLMQDIGGSAVLENNHDFAMAPFLYSVSCCHCMPVSLGQGGAGLGTMWGWETALEMLKIAGFSNSERHVLPHDPMNVWFVSQKA